MLIYRQIIFYILLLCIIMEVAAKDATSATFTVYAFIPWQRPINNGQHDNKSQLSDYLLSYGIKPIKVIYEIDYLTNGKIDLEKIKQIAEKTAMEPDIPVSFDMEFGNRFKPQTVIPKVKAILQNYRSYKPKALVGIYATIPQNTYSWKPTIFSYDKLNLQYSSLINYVDFLSPVLYNYDGYNFQAWAKGARYNIKAAQYYASGKPVIPYISPIYRLGSTKHVKNGNLVEELDEESMAKRLQTLHDLGARACIIWASSQDRKKDGTRPAFDPDKAWGKAVVEFIKTHSENDATEIRKLNNDD